MENEPGSVEHEAMQEVSSLAEEFQQQRGGDTFGSIVERSKQKII